NDTTRLRHHPAGATAQGEFHGFGVTWGVQRLCGEVFGFLPSKRGEGCWLGLLWCRAWRGRMVAQCGCICRWRRCSRGFGRARFGRFGWFAHHSPFAGVVVGGVSLQFRYPTASGRLLSNPLASLV